MTVSAVYGFPDDRSTVDDGGSTAPGSVGPGATRPDSK